MESLGAIYLSLGFIYAIYVFARYGGSGLTFIGSDHIGISLVLLVFFLLGLIWPVAILVEIFSRKEFEKQIGINVGVRETREKVDSLPSGIGTATTDFMPSGRFEINRELHEGRCTSKVKVIRKGAKVVVVGKDGFQFIVEPWRELPGK